jgi:Zn-dependent alcohol dehydrogenase
VNVTAAVLRRTEAARPYTASRPLELTSISLAGPGRGEVLVRIRAAGLCHSDLSVIDGSRPRPLPMALGHEAAGEIVEVGPDVADCAPGDHVVLAFVPSCGHCAPCRQGRPALCEPGAAANAGGELLGGGRRLSHEGAEIHHHLGVSAFADHAVVSARSVVHVPKDLPFEIAALFGCAVLTGVGAAVNAAQVRPGESVAVFGLGGVGLAALLGALAAGAHPVVAVDRVEHKLDLALALGATHAVLASETVVEDVRDIVGGGVEKAIETVGSAAVLGQAYAATRRGGSTTTVGLPDPSAELKLSATSLTTEERTLRGSYLGSSVPTRDIPRYVELYRAGRLPVDRLLSDTIPFDDLNAGFERLAAGEAVRLVVRMGL